MRLLLDTHLLLWAADLTLIPITEGPAHEAVSELRVVGPLDRPQLLLRRPETAPAP